MKKVLIYTTPVCQYCKLAKEFFKKNNVEYQEIDVVKDQNAMQEAIKKSHQMGVPVIDIEGEIIVGFNRSEIERALGIGASAKKAA